MRLVVVEEWRTWFFREVKVPRRKTWKRNVRAYGDGDEQPGVLLREYSWGVVRD